MPAAVAEEAVRDLLQRAAMPSYMRPSTRAVSAMDAFLPLWEPSGPRQVTCAP
jgi:hypothetical protein